jgi:hypothetical protein
VYCVEKQLFLWLSSEGLWSVVRICKGSSYQQHKSSA